MAKNLYHYGIEYIASPANREGKNTGVLILDESGFKAPPSVEDFHKYLSDEGRKNVLKKNIVIFHHDDMDGAFAAACVSGHMFSLQPTRPINSFIHVNVNYDRQNDLSVLDLVKEGDIVFVLDFAFSRPVTQELSKKAGFFLTLDHHKSNQLSLQGEPGTYFDMNASGAKMAWNYFFPKRKDVPIAITLADNRDLWKKTDGREDMFHEAMMVLRSKCKDNHEFIGKLVDRIDWHQYLNGEYPVYDISNDIEVGRPIIDKRDSNIKHAISERRLTKTDICGYPAVMFNYCVDQSDACEFVYKEPEFRDNIVIAYSVLANGQVNLSFRKGPDCRADLAQIAEINFNGGGHEAAAGGQVTLEVLGKMISGKMKYALCWKTSEVEAVLSNVQLDKADKVASLFELTPYMVSRDICEYDTSWKQIIPYVVIRNKQGEYLAYRRPPTGGEERLFGNSSIGFGGHVDSISELSSFESHLTEEACREIIEEIGVNPQNLLNIRQQLYLQLRIGHATILNTSDSAGIYHLGIGLIITLEDGEDLKINESEIMNPTWVHKSQLESIENPEEWTNAMINCIQVLDKD